MVIIVTAYSITVPGHGTEYMSCLLGKMLLLLRIIGAKIIDRQKEHRERTVLPFGSLYGSMKLCKEVLPVEEVCLKVMDGMFFDLLSYVNSYKIDDKQ